MRKSITDLFRPKGKVGRPSRSDRRQKKQAGPAEPTSGPDSSLQASAKADAAASSSAGSGADATGRDLSKTAIEPIDTTPNADSGASKVLPKVHLESFQIIDNNPSGPVAIAQDMLRKALESLLEDLRLKTNKSSSDSTFGFRSA